MQPQSNLSGEHEGLQACLPHTYWSPSSIPTSIHNLGDDQNLLFTLAPQVYTGASESTLVKQVSHYLSRDQAGAGSSFQEEGRGVPNALLEVGVPQISEYRNGFLRF